MRKTSSGSLWLIYAIVMTVLCVINIYRVIGATMGVSPLVAVLTGVGAVAGWLMYLRKRREAKS